MKYALAFASTFLYFTLTSQNTPQTILWEISIKNSPFKSYLFGTFHEVDPAFFTTLRTTVEKLQASEMVFVEETGTQALDNTTTMAQLSVWDKAQWDSLLTPEQKTIFQAFIEKAERPDFYRLPPLVLNRSIAGMYLLEFCDSGTRQSYEIMDRHIEKLALQSQKQVHSLDDNQVNLLKTTSLSLDARRNLIYAQYCTEGMAKMLRDDMSDCNILSKYQIFDIDYQLDTDLTQIPDYSPLLMERNNKWISKLDPALQSQSCFIAVGFKHLFYKQGMIQQLRSLGYTVTPVSPV